MSPMLHGNDPLPYSLQLCNYKEYFVMGGEGHNTKYKCTNYTKYVSPTPGLNQLRLCQWYHEGRILPFGAFRAYNSMLNLFLEALKLLSLLSRNVI